MFNTWETDSRGLARSTPTGPATALQATAFEEVTERLLTVLRPCMKFQPVLGRGGSSLNQLLVAFANRWLDGSVGSEQVQLDNSKLVAAQQVDVEKLRLPTNAGEIQTSTLLPTWVAEVFDVEAKRVLPQQPAALPRPCFMVSPVAELSLRSRFLQTNMVVAVPDAEIDTRADGRLL